MEFLGKVRDRGVGTAEFVQNAAPGRIRERANEASRRVAEY